MHVLFCLQCSSAGLVGAAALVQRKLAVPEDARDLERGGHTWELHSSTAALLSSDFRAELQLAGCF